MSVVNHPLGPELVDARYTGAICCWPWVKGAGIIEDDDDDDETTVERRLGLVYTTRKERGERPEKERQCKQA